MSNQNQNNQHPQSDIEQRGFHQIHALQIGTDIDTYGEWQKSISEGSTLNFYDWAANKDDDKKEGK